MHRRHNKCYKELEWTISSENKCQGGSNSGRKQTGPIKVRCSKSPHSQEGFERKSANQENDSVNREHHLGNVIPPPVSQIIAFSCNF